MVSLSSDDVHWYSLSSNETALAQSALPCTSLWLKRDLCIQHIFLCIERQTAARLPGCFSCTEVSFSNVLEVFGFLTFCISAALPAVCTLWGSSYVQNLLFCSGTANWYFCAVCLMAAGCLSVPVVCNCSTVLTLGWTPSFRHPSFLLQCCWWVFPGVFRLGLQ